MGEAMPETGGMPPLDPDPLGSHIWAQLMARSEADGDRPTAHDTLFRGSFAGACSRQVQLKIIGHPLDIPVEGGALMIFEIGHRWHDDWLGPALVDVFNAKLEVAASWLPEFSLSCWLDGLFDVADVDTEIVKRYGLDRFERVGAEFKSMATYGFELATGTKQKWSEPPGPKWEHVAQSALGCLAPDVGADASLIVYGSKEKGAIASWLFGMDEELPHLGGATPRLIAEAELRRFAGIASRLEAGELAKPVIPGHGLVTSPPARGSRGQPWNCRFCPYQPTCEAMGPDVAPLTRLTETETQCRSA